MQTQIIQFQGKPSVEDFPKTSGWAINAKHCLVKFITNWSKDIILRQNFMCNQHFPMAQYQSFSRTLSECLITIQKEKDIHWGWLWLPCLLNEWPKVKYYSYLMIGRSVWENIVPGLLKACINIHIYQWPWYKADSPNRTDLRLFLV